MNGYICELDVEINYDHQPYESATRNYPGCDESVTVNGFDLVRTDDTGREVGRIEVPVEFLTKDQAESLYDQVIEKLQDRAEYEQSAKEDWADTQATIKREEAFERRGH